MKIQLKKMGGFLYGADPISKGTIKKLKGDSFKCDVTRLKEETTDDIRSLAQNRLLHLWHEDQAKTQVNEHAGNTAAEWKDLMKMEILWDMYIAHNINGFAEVILPMMKGYNAQEVYVAKCGLIKRGWITTRDLTVPQFTLYLREIERWCHWRGITLRTDNYLLGLAGLVNDGG